jgi:hypothetical protein
MLNFIYNFGYKRSPRPNGEEHGFRCSEKRHLRAHVSLQRRKISLDAGPFGPMQNQVRSVKHSGNTRKGVKNF